MQTGHFRKIGQKSQLQESGPALVFQIGAGSFDSGFVILFKDRLYAYRNSCPHTGGNLDWMPGDVFDEAGEFLICATHGAIFDPETGKCINGPCLNQRLTPVSLHLDGDEIFAELPITDVDSVSLTCKYQESFE